jgi:hypothetical protein
MEWTPAAIEDVKRIVSNDLATCTKEQHAEFQRYAILPAFAAILRYGKREEVVVVAKKQNEVIYWEDVEEGFNISLLADDGSILEHYCNQDSLGTALNRWMGHSS